MKRRLVQMGEHSLMSVIPKKWLDKHSLSKGDSIEFIEIDNKLILTSTAEVFEKRIEIDLGSKVGPHLWRLIQPTYTSGYDEVKITFSNIEILSYIETSINLLIGFEIIETGDNYAILKSVTKTIDDDVKPILKRVWLLLGQIAKNTEEYFKTKNNNKLKEIHSLEMSINKYTMFLKRIINRTGYKYHHYTYLIINFLELTANHYEYIRKFFEEKPLITIGKEELKQLKKINRLLEQTYDVYYKYTQERFIRIENELPHFEWFKTLDESELKTHFKSIAEYLMQIARLSYSVQLEN